ncbi:MAG: TIM barrel protein [Candidatus Aenigmarchaeota archaeon]|nr:TIM barrel protein [Candidatus Aenigmarchaeota archaeon]
MKLGIKIYPKLKEGKYVEYFVKNKITDFVEVMSIKGTDYGFLKKYKTPWVIHSSHHVVGTFIANPDREEQSMGALRFTQKLADDFSSKFIIVHPSSPSGKNDIETTISILKKINDKRILIENVVNKFGGDFEGVERVIKETGSGFCLDIPHAIAAAKIRGIDYMDYIKQFLKLKPKMVHISDGYIDSKIDKHLNFGEGDFPWKKLLRLIPKNVLVTVETNPVIETQKKNFEFLRKNL